MKIISFFDTKPYDREYFEKGKEEYGFEIRYFEEKLNKNTSSMAEGSDAVVAFVSDTIDQPVIEKLYQLGIKVIGMRCAGYNNIDFKAAYEKVHILRVPNYSPYAVAEHALGLLLTLNRKLHRAYNRTKEFNFSLNGLTGFDIHGKTIGVIGTGKIGRTFLELCQGFGVKLLAYDPYKSEGLNAEYVSLEELCRCSDIISLHCPLTKETKHMIGKETLDIMKEGVFILNTSRGSLIDSEALLEAIKSHKVGAAGLDVYEEETDLFYEDFSNNIIQDDILSLLISMPNVLVTSHQAFLTEEALANIANTTLKNLKEFFDGEPLPNEICYQCLQTSNCKKDHIKRCFN